MGQILHGSATATAAVRRAMQDMRWVSQSTRARLTLARLRSSAMRLFFIRIAQPFERLIDARDRGPHPMGMRQRPLQLCQRDIGILMDKFDQKTVEGASRLRPVLRGFAAGARLAPCRIL